MKASVCDSYKACPEKQGAPSSNHDLSGSFICAPQRCFRYHIVTFSNQTQHTILSNLLSATVQASTTDKVNQKLPPAQPSPSRTATSIAISPSTTDQHHHLPVQNCHQHHHLSVQNRHQHCHLSIQNCHQHHHLPI
ncbi:hypothetical protein EMCRGX_G028475 [Ephydatia muelleri]